MANKIQQFLVANGIPQDLTIEKLAAFYGITERDTWEVIVIDDGRPLLIHQKGEAYVYDPTRWRPTLLPPLDWWVNAEGEEAAIAAELTAHFGAPTDGERYDNATETIWQDGLARVRMIYHPKQENVPEASCSVIFTSGFRPKLSEREGGILRAMTPLASVAGATHRQSFEAADVHLGVLREFAGFDGVAADRAFLCAGDGRQVAMLNVGQINGLRLVHRRYRADISSSLDVDYRDPFSPGKSERTFTVYASDDHVSLEEVGPRLAEALGKDLRREKDEQDY